MSLFLSRENVNLIFIEAYKQCLTEIYGRNYSEIISFNTGVGREKLNFEIEKMGRYFAENLDAKAVEVYSCLGKNMLRDAIIEKIRSSFNEDFDEAMAIDRSDESFC